MKKMSPMRLAVPALLVLPFLGACGSGVSTTVKVGSLQSSARRGAHFRSFPTDAPQSSTAYSFAKVDGIKLNLTRLQVKNGSNEQDAVTWSPSKEVEVAPGAANTIAITETATIAPGTYSGLKMRYENSYKVKAYCRTATKLVYTTATGVKAIDPAGVTTPPGDYDYFAYPFAAVTVATSATGGNPETMEETDASFTITAGSTPSLAVLIDPSYLVTCFDGTAANASNPDALSPFMWGNNNGLTTADFFPDNVPNFGMGYVPMFIWLSTDSAEAAPTAEVYASSTTNTDVNGATINFLHTNITTFAFKADGSILDARTRIGANGSSGTLYQMSSGFTFTAPNYTFMNGEWMCDTGYTNCGPIQDRQITNFQRTANMTTVVNATIQDGPDCGKTGTFPGHPEWGNRYRDCLGSGVTNPLYFIQVPR